MTTDMQAPTEEQIVAAARALANHNADTCNVNREDNWMIYGDSFRESAEIALKAALASRPDAQADERGAKLYRFIEAPEHILVSDEIWAQRSSEWQPVTPDFVDTEYSDWMPPIRRAASPQAPNTQHEKSDLYKEGYAAGKKAAQESFSKLISCDPNDEALGLICEALALKPEGDITEAILGAIEELKTKAQGVRLVVEIRPIVMAGSPDACQVWLRHPNGQQFAVGNPHETRADGEWFADQLRKALFAPSPAREQVVVVEASGLSRQSRAMLLNVLWHHQGGSSSFGQPIRAILGIGQHDHLTDEQLAEAKWIDGLLASPSRECGERIAWEATTPVYTKYITDERYQRLRPESRKWYKPYRCSRCEESSSAPTLGEQFEQLDMQNHIYRRAMQKIMKRLTELLDEDRFAEIEGLVKGAGVEPPAVAQPLTDEQRAVVQKAADVAFKILIAGGDYGDELADLGLRAQLKDVRAELCALLAKGE